MNADLSQLKDIHIPDKPPVWPLAAGWWLVILCTTALVVITILVIVFYLTGTRRSVRKEFKQLEQLPDAAYLPALNRLLKRVAKNKQPGTASLYGRAWFAYLNKTPNVHFEKEDVALFEKRLYNGSTQMTHEQRTHIHHCAAVWLKHNL